ncbi:MAG: 50S ribosomal protein L10 [Chloroflexi bacterium]|nr:50S ribosomal protein L10 [Chloroflexota bacterium]
MPSDKKAKAVEELKRKLSDCTIAIGTDYKGLKVSAMTDLRRALRERGMEYKVVKNTLSYIAADELGKSHIKKIIQGPTGLIFGYGNPVDPAKVVVEYIRNTRSALTITGAVLNGRLLAPAEVTSLANLPPRSELVSQLLGQLQAPIANLVTVLNAPIRGLVAVLQRHIEKSQTT